MNDNEQPELRTYREPPQLTAGITAPVIVPALQALITGVLSGLCAGVLVAAVNIGVSYWTAGFVVWTVVTLVSWLSYRGRWQWVIERVLGVDLNNDGYIGQPAQAAQPPQQQPLRIELVENNGQHTQFIDLPFPEKLPALAAGLTQGRQFSQSVWTGNGQLFSRTEFEALRAELLKRGLARWKNPDAPAQGVELTGPGRAVMRQISNHPER